MISGAITERGSQPPEAQAHLAAAPGLVLVFAERRPTLAVFPVREQLALGRGGTLEDRRMSREHALVRYSGGELVVQDRGSRNGSCVDGRAAPAHGWAPLRRVLRLGDSIFLAVADTGPFHTPDAVRVHDGRVSGPNSQRLAAAIARAARHGNSLHLHGESGVGKEGAARLFHAAGPAARGPFVAVNCAAIPPGIAERLLFGARRGAYSGQDHHTEGYVQAAHGGTLFLDEVAELDLQVQAKLLRVLDSGEVLALGATRPQPIDLRVCSATHKDLADEVAAGRLREDLYYRIGRPALAIPPLRERLEEIPQLITTTLRALSDELWPHPALVEACMLRSWPGNIRELATEIRVAGQEAIGEGSAKVLDSHLSARAGLTLVRPPVVRDEAAAEPASLDPAALAQLREQPKAPGSRAALAAVLRSTAGNVSEAARVLGMHRTQLRRLLEHHELS
ncbi:sigma 54-interacting transcriptional regulator [Nannocystis sp. SCPEA4]|uniref:sigma 54-interacting transcriptional regulator n=1 Tax=Nannocystis sp. SCPEA4 TaxID=2996787 RepID=UPI00226E831E|nr:sigma 54-interacting transcriptional regulator [Nannocystis sp. SCPEA4]